VLLASRLLPIGVALAAVVGAGGCGSGSGGSGSGGSSHAARSATAATPAGAPQRQAAPESRRAARHVELRLPRDWHVARHPVTRRNWPVPLKVAASFPIHRGSPSASCPVNVIRSMPPDGVYLMVAEFTRDRPSGIPPRGSLPPRGDLSRLDIRPSEVECWEHGLSGAKDFTENGRSFRVEILLGSRVSAERRRQALEALGSLRLPPARP
jgi:hypothetical protein